MQDFLGILVIALINLNKSDNSLIQRRLNEVCLNHKLANYLEFGVKHILKLKWVDVDLEYDKNYKDKKFIQTKHGKRAIRPDILIHKREDNSKNLFALECKKGYLNKNDREKLSILLQYPYDYSLTCGISYLPDKDYMLVKIFEGDRILTYHFDKKLQQFKLKNC